MKKSENILMIAASEYDANLYYATKFIAPDPFIFVQLKGRKYLLMNDLEVDRAKLQAKVHTVISTTTLAKAYVKKHGKRPSYIGLIAEFLKSKKAKNILVPGNFPIEYADPLRELGFKLTVKGDPFYEERTIKSKEEVRAVEKALRHVETSIDLVVKMLRKATIKKGRVYYKGKPVTSESIKQIINVSLMENGCIGNHTIVACGKQAVDPHNEGSGPIYANESIIIDIFPRDTSTRYHGDFTRTLVKGKAKPKLKAMYDAVYEGQEIAFKELKPGVDASKVHTKIHRRFEELGFPTGMINGRMQGFFHGTGHGLGLDIHEQPRFGGVKEIMKEGHVVTVEPGLYYEGAGGVRLEDVVVITKTGNRNLTKYPKFLEIK